MPDTSRGYTYPASTGSTRLWEWFQELAEDIDVDVAAVEAAVAARFIYVYKASAETVTSSTTLQDDDELFVTLPVGVWQITVILSVQGAAAGDFKMSYTFTGGTTGTPGRIVLGPAAATTDSTATTVRATQNGTGTAIAYGVDAALASAIREEMLYQVASEGVLTVQWAQNASSGTATTVNAGSRIVAIRVG